SSDDARRRLARPGPCRRVRGVPCRVRVALRPECDRSGHVHGCRRLARTGCDAGHLRTCTAREPPGSTPRTQVKIRAGGSSGSLTLESDLRTRRRSLSVTVKLRAGCRLTRSTYPPRWTLRTGD